MGRFGLPSLIITLLISVCGAPAPARPHLIISLPIPGEISGQVRFAADRAPAEHVFVRLETFGGAFIAQAQTDRTGKFRFSGLALGLYTVTVRHPGFDEVQQQVDLQTTPTANLFIQLKPTKPDVARDAETTAPLLDSRIPAEARREFEKGRAALIDHKKPSEGVAHLEKAISIYPDFVEAQLLLGTAWMDAQKWEKAEQALRRVLEINPKAAQALFALGEVYLRQERYAEAEKSLQEGLRLESNSWHGHFTLGRVYYGKGDLAKAGPEAGRAIQLKPDYADAHLLAGN